MIDHNESVDDSMMNQDLEFQTLEDFQTFIKKQEEEYEADANDITVNENIEDEEKDDIVEQKTKVVDNKERSL